MSAEQDKGLMLTFGFVGFLVGGWAMIFVGLFVWYDAPLWAALLSACGAGAVGAAVALAALHIQASDEGKAE